MSDHPLNDILAALSGLNEKVDTLAGKVDALSGLNEKVDTLAGKVDALSGLNERVDTLAGKVDALSGLNERVDTLAVQIIKVRTEISERLDNLSNQIGFLRDDAATTFFVADRAVRINQDVNRSVEQQLASMVRQIRTLDNRMRTIEDTKTP